MSIFGQTRLSSIAIGLAVLVLSCADAIAGSAEDAAKKFFDAYRAKDVDAMGQLFTKDATFVYVPFGEAGTGNVLEKGVSVWRTLIETFPDLRNEVGAVWEDKTGRVAFVDVHIGGKQAKDGFGISNQGKDFWLRHLFVLETDGAGHITKITSFWDNATWFSQLGKTSLK
jgi:ketosteroid isomerase-like protein